MYLGFNKQYSITQPLNNKLPAKTQTSENNQQSKTDLNYFTSQISYNSIAFGGIAFRVRKPKKSVVKAQNLTDKVGYKPVIINGKIAYRRIKPEIVTPTMDKYFLNLAHLSTEIRKEAKIEVMKWVCEGDVEQIPLHYIKEFTKNIPNNKKDELNVISETLDWIADNGMMPYVPFDMSSIYSALLKNKNVANPEIKNPIMKIIGTFAQVEDIEKAPPNNVMEFITGKAEQGSEAAKDTLDKLYKAELLREKAACLDEVDKTVLNDDKLREIKEKKLAYLLQDLSRDNFNERFTKFKNNILDGYVNNENNLITNDHIKFFISIIKDGDENLALKGVRLIDGLATTKYNRLKEVFAEDITQLKPIIDRIESEDPVLSNFALHAVKKIVQNDIIYELPDEYAGNVLKKLGSEDIQTLDKTIAIQKKVMCDSFEHNQPIDFIKGENIQQMYELINHKDRIIAAESMHRLQKILTETSKINSVPDNTIKSLLDNNLKPVEAPFDDLDVIKLEDALLLVRIFKEKGFLNKNNGTLITKEHANALLELLDNEKPRVSNTALKTINELLDFKSIKNIFDPIDPTIDNSNKKAVEKIMNNLNSSDTDTIISSMKLLNSLDYRNLLKQSSAGSTPLFRNQIIEEEYKFNISDDSLKFIFEQLKTENQIKPKIQSRRIRALNTLNILSRYKFINKNSKYINDYEELIKKLANLKQAYYETPVDGDEKVKELANTLLQNLNIY